MNAASVSPQKAIKILELFHPVNRPSLVNFTPEEMFYSYKLLQGRFRKGTHFWQGLKAHLVLYLRKRMVSERAPFSTEQYSLMALEWRDEYQEFLQLPEKAEREDIDRLRSRFTLVR